MNSLEILKKSAKDEAVAPETLLSIAEIAGVKSLKPVNKAISVATGSKKVITSTVAAGTAAVAASGLTVAATSGAGITTALAAAGGIVGGGMAAAPAVLAGGPTYLAVQGINNTIFKNEENLDANEASARSAARKGTSIGATVGVVGTSAAVVAGGASGAAIMSTLATVGSVVGGGAIAGTALLVAAPAAAAFAAGYGIYKFMGGGKD